MKTVAAVPSCIGIIMDGNRRYARERGVPTLVGHRTGLAKMKEVVGWALDAGVQTVIFYAFSTENWKRPMEEVQYLMKLFVHALRHELKDIRERGVRIRFIGNLAQFPESVEVEALRIEEETKNAENGTVVIALSYGGRTEIAEAAHKLQQKRQEAVTEEQFRAALPSADIPDPDLIIRTGGEHRLSNFLLFQAAYSELAFIDTKWPSLSHEEFTAVLDDYAARERRHGR